MCSMTGVNMELWETGVSLLNQTGTIQVSLEVTTFKPSFEE